MPKSKRLSGFTIVELLIVIVVIAILAAIAVVAYTGVQRRANDSKRLSDMSAMIKAIKLYAADTGSFPPTQANPGYNTWERSTDPGFMSSLNSYTNNTVFRAPSGSTYWYHRFNAGEHGCPASLGQYYIVWADGMQTQTGAANIQTNGCTGQTIVLPSEVTDPQNWVYFGFINS